MEQKEYNSYVERWKKYWKDEKIYYEEKRKLVIRSDAGENVEKEFKKLDKRFGHGDLFSSYACAQDRAMEVDEGRMDADICNGCRPCEFRKIRQPLYVRFS